VPPAVAQSAQAASDTSTLSAPPLPVRRNTQPPSQRKTRQEQASALCTSSLVLLMLIETLCSLAKTQMRKSSHRPLHRSGIPAVPSGTPVPKWKNPPPPSRVPNVANPPEKKWQHLTKPASESPSARPSSKRQRASNCRSPRLTSITTRLCASLTGGGVDCKPSAAALNPFRRLPVRRLFFPQNRIQIRLIHQRDPRIDKRRERRVRIKPVIIP
jgi:hypothetical protein